MAAILFVVGAVLLVALRSWLDRPAGEVGIDGEARVAAEVEAEPVEPVFEPELLAEPVVTSSPTPARAAVSAPVAAQAVPTTVIILPARAESDDPAATAVTEAVRQSTLRALRAMPSIHVVEVGSADLAAIVPPNAGPLGADNLVYLAVTRRYEGRVVAEIFEQPAEDSRFWSLNLRVRSPSGGGSSSGGLSKSGDPRVGDDAESMGIRYAERIARGAERAAEQPSLASSTNPGTTYARNVFLDTTRSDSERLQALRQILEHGVDGAEIATAIDLAMRSTSAQTRQRVFTLLRQSTYDPMLAQPVSYALLSDADAMVRQEAALALAAYSGDPTASAALEHAARNDSSPEVRLAAEIASMDFDEQQNFKREALLDRSLTPAERLAPTIVDNNLRWASSDRSSGPVSVEELLAYAEIMTAAEDPLLKFQGLGQLREAMLGGWAPAARRSSADDAKIVDAVIETSRHADQNVRRQALMFLTTLAQLSGNADARAALESAVEREPDLATELRIPDLLTRLPAPSNPAQ